MRPGGDLARWLIAFGAEPGGIPAEPWESLFHRFDASLEIRLTGKNASGRQRRVALRALSRPEDLARVREPLRVPAGEAEEGPAAAGARVLEIRCEAGKEGGGTYHAVADAAGVRVTPIPPPPPVPVSFRSARAEASASEEAECFGRLEVQDRHGAVVEALRVIEPRLRRLAMVVSAGRPVLHGDVGIGRLVPLSLMGEGMARLASLVIDIAGSPGGVVLVDEIENGLHHSVLEPVWSAVAGAARKFDTQILATTHSYECIAAAHRAFAKAEPYDFRLHRLERAGEDVRAVTFDRESMETAVEGGLEVR